MNNKKIIYLIVKEVLTGILDLSFVCTGGFIFFFVTKNFNPLVRVCATFIYARSVTAVFKQLGDELSNKDL